MLLLLFFPLSAAGEELQLSTALEELEGANEDWQVLAERVKQARALRREATAQLLPQLSAGAAGVYNGEEVELGDRIVRRQLDWSVSGTASITVFDGTAYPLVSQATRGLEAVELDAEWQRRTLRFEVERAFYLLAAAQRDLQLADQTVKVRKAYVERAQALEASGIALPLDVARARVQQLEAEQLVLEADTRLTVASNALAVLLGREPRGGLRATSTAPAPAPPADVAVPEDRPDIEAGLRQIEAAEALKTSRWWALAPSLGLRGDVNAGQPSFSSPSGVSWSITLAATWILYDGGARYARIQAAESQLREAQLQQSQRERLARAGVADALRRWRTADQAIKVAEEQVEVAKQAYDMTVARFESGLATSIEVTEASDAVFRAGSALSTARLDSDIAAAQFQYLSEAP